SFLSCLVTTADAMAWSLLCGHAQARTSRWCAPCSRCVAHPSVLRPCRSQEALPLRVCRNENRRRCPLRSLRLGAGSARREGAVCPGRPGRRVGAEVRRWGMREYGNTELWTYTRMSRVPYSRTLLTPRDTTRPPLLAEAEPGDHGAIPLD